MISSEFMHLFATFKEFLTPCLLMCLYIYRYRYRCEFRYRHKWDSMLFLILWLLNPIPYAPREHPWGSGFWRQSMIFLTWHPLAEAAVWQSIGELEGTFYIIVEESLLPTCKEFSLVLLYLNYLVFMWTPQTRCWLGKLEAAAKGQLLGLQTLGRVLGLVWDLERLRGMSIYWPTVSQALC